MTKDEDMALCPRRSRLNEQSGQCFLLFELACLILEFFFPAVQPYFTSESWKIILIMTALSEYHLLATDNLSLVLAAICLC